MLTLSGYRIASQLCDSTRSQVYRGFRISDQQSVVLKLLKEDYPTPERLARFKREYEILCNLRIAGVVDAYALEQDQQRWVIVLEDFGGSSLAQLDLAGNLKLADFLQLAIKITEILGQIHTAQIIHKDLNPANIVLNATTGEVKIVDFDLSTELSRETPSFSNPNVLEGTFAYLSPEQTGRMNRAIDYRSDFYALGVTLYELLTGQLPFEEPDALGLVHSHIAKQPTPPYEVGQWGDGARFKVISDIVIKLMAKNAENRYQSAYGLQVDLEKCLHQLQHRGKIEAFPLGQQDICDRLQIPQQLYGRETEVETLLAAFARVSEGQLGRGEIHVQIRNAGPKLKTQARIQPPPLPSQIEMVLITGYAGVGKTTLVREVHKPITAKHGTFISGKFDQYQRNIPYSAIRQAFHEFCEQLLAESPERLNQGRQKILDAVGNNGQILIEFIPSLELVIGEQPPIAQVGPQEAQNRFDFIFQNFVKEISQAEHPLVLFLDDLQWADVASLRLLNLLMGDQDNQYCLIIGAYRDNEVDPSHPLLLTLENINKEGGVVTSIHLGNLSNSDVNALLSEALACPSNYSQPLTDVVYAKTQGNPFFTTEFLKSLYKIGLLAFNSQLHQWQWDLCQIQARNITDNVVDLMIGQIYQLPNATQQVLQLAACIGSPFELGTLAIIDQRQPAEVLADLWPALPAGLVLPLSDRYQLIEATEDQNLPTDDVKFKFLHDRVQQAAYSLIDETEKQGIHLRIGRLLFSTIEPEILEENPFEIVNQFNAGITLIEQEQEKIKLAQLNVLAGQKAKTALAYSAAVNYFMIAQELLPEDSWNQFYDLTLTLYIEAVEATFLYGDFQQAKRFTNVVLECAKTVIEKVKVYDTQIQAYIAQNQMEAAIDTGLEVLELLGISLETSSPQDLTIEVLEALPEMSDPVQLAAQKLLMRITTPAYIANPDLVPPIVFTMLKRCIDAGNSSLSAFVYAVYGFILGAAMEDIELGYQFGKLALRMADQFKSSEITSRVENIFCTQMLHWKESVSNAVARMPQLIPISLENGDYEYAAYTAIEYCDRLWTVGRPLKELYQELKTYLDLVQKLKQEEQLHYVQLIGQFVLNLIGESANSKQLTGKLFDETEMLSVFQERQNLISLRRFYLAKTTLSFLFKDYAGAVSHATLAESLEHAVVGLLIVPEQNFYYSLALLALSLTTESDQQAKYLETVAANQQKMRHWADLAPMNFQHKYDLIAAEQARVLEEPWRAMELYEQAIQGARDNNYLHEEALAYELAAEFYLGQGMEKIACTYLKEAHYGYIRWQATAKVEDLERRYPQFLAQIPSSSVHTGTPTPSTSSSTTASTTLDLSSILKASQTLSEEIELEHLLTKLMKIVIENAGAQRGLLILNKSGQWVIEAVGEIATDEVQVLQSIPLERVGGKSETPMLCHAIVNYVIRTQGSLVLSDATHTGNFTRRPYVIKQQPKSILCTPLLNQGDLVGVLYLENNLITAAFTSERIELLRLLSGQIAIAIENAKLYSELQMNYKTLTQFLDAIPVGVGVVDATGRPYYLNSIAQQIAGQEIRKDLTTEHFPEVYQLYRAGTDQLYPHEELPIARALKGEQVTVDDLEIRRGDQIIPIESRTTPIYDDEGNIAYAINAFQDITARKQAEQLLRDYNRTLEQQVAERTQALTQALEDLKAAQQELIQSEKMAALGQLVANIAHEINTPLGAIRASIDNISTALEQSLYQLPQLLQYLSAAQQTDFLALLAAAQHKHPPLSFKEERQLKRALRRQLTIHDISEADTITETLIKMGLTQAIEPFLPLLRDPNHTLILETAYNLSMQQRNSENIMLAVEQVSKIVFALKSYARHDESGQMVRVDITEGIDVVLTLYHNQLKRGIEVTRNYQQVPPILCYPDQLNQVWTNLIHNAIYAMNGQGQFVISVGQLNDYVVVNITDLGCGIPTEIQDKIFEPFFTTKPAGEGSGLGLDIVRQIINKHQGRITVESQPGQTTFSVWLPINALKNPDE